MNNEEARNLSGCCGLFCGLCNKYQSRSPSRCIGCRLGEQHAWCSIWNCCVKKHGLETCTECRDIFHCPVFLRRKVAEWVPAADNLRHIQDVGLKAWSREQRERQALLEEMLLHYNEGRSMNLYCKACARMPIDLIKVALEKTGASFPGGKADPPDVKTRAKVLKAALHEFASKNAVDLS